MLDASPLKVLNEHTSLPVTCSTLSTLSARASTAGLVTQGAMQPLEAFEESFASSGTTRLDVPRLIASEGSQPHRISDLLGAHGTGQVLLVGEYEA